ncbi:hypothetical protein F5X96DRAFT_685673 [Biscogniauxia mediterranea]|nr:hypothetical protein F5X96DRAFT_685673 [Biscogniauxia mediterranea]
MAQSTSSSGPVVCRPATGCKVTLGAGIMPINIQHNEKKCKCIPAETPEQLERLVDSVKNAMAMNILDSEKPSMALAMLLLEVSVLNTMTKR